MSGATAVVHRGKGIIFKRPCCNIKEPFIFMLSKYQRSLADVV